MSETSGLPFIWRRWLVWLLALGILSFYEARVMGIIVSRSALTDMSLGILQGAPGCEAFQSRIAGPFLVLGASKLTGLSFAYCHLLFDLGMVFLSNLIPLLIFRRVIADRLAVYALVLLTAAGFVAVQAPGLARDFDLIDFCTMFLFAYAVFFDFPILGLILLFIVELLNREAAAFIALWMMIDGSLSLVQKIDKTSFFKIGVGAALMAAGILWTKFIRECLIKAHPQTMDSDHMFHGQIIQIGKNLHEMMRPSIAVYTLSGLVIFLFVRYARYKLIPAWHACKIGLLLAAFLIFLFLFAEMSEARVWGNLVPFMIFMYIIPLGLARGYHGSSPSGEMGEASPP